MSETLMLRPAEDFASALAAREPVPGGGGAAAYVGALGVALCSMVGNFTTGKRTYAAVEDDVQRMLAEATEAECDEMLAAYIPRAEACAAAVMRRIRS